MGIRELVFGLFVLNLYRIFIAKGKRLGGILSILKNQNGGSQNLHNAFSSRYFKIFKLKMAI